MVNKQDGMRWAALVVGVLFLAIMVLVGFTDARAADFLVQTAAYRPYGAGPLDSCRIYVQGGWDAGNLDSTQRYTTSPISRPSGAGNAIDTMVRYAVVTTASLDADYNPQIFALWWFDSDPEPVPDNACNISVFGISATASVDYDSINDIVVAAVATASGTGVYSDSIRVLRTSDSTGVGAGAILWLRPNGGGDYLNARTDANGWAKFNVDTDTFLVLFWTPGYQAVIVPDTNRVPGVDVKDTVWVTALTPASQPAPGLTPVTFTFYDGLGSPIKNVILRYNLESKSTTAYHLRDSSIVIDPSKVWEARSASTGIATINITPNDSILVAGGQANKTSWRVKAYTPDGLIPLLGTDGVTLAVPASATSLTYPQDWE